MYNDKSSRYIGQYPELAPSNIEIFEHIIGKEAIEKMKQLAAPLENKQWAHVSSTFQGGGVAEMLQSIVPITRGLGIESDWYCIEGEEDFFVTTKKFHNAIQGIEQEFSLEDLFQVYLETVKRNFNGEAVDADMTVVHDPQPCASIVHGNYLGKVLWRCHIDTTNADPVVWDFLLPYINNYDGAIFSLQDFVRGNLKVPTYLITPAINPLSTKNKQRTRAQALKTVLPLLEEHDIDPERPLILAVSRFDVHKNQGTIIRAFKELKNRDAFKKKHPMLVLVGNLASDDPEGLMMYKKILELIDEDPDIRALLNIPNNDENVGALMRLASTFVHVSTREGFGLVVTEAMWQGTPVIGSRVGGIQLQVIEDETGFLVDPFDTGKIAEHMSYLINHPEERDHFSQNAVAHVRENFLITNQISKYLTLMRYLVGVDRPQYAL